MVAIILYITLFNLGVETSRNGVQVVQTIKAIHHHSTRPLYRHVVRPVVNTMKGRR